MRAVKRDPLGSLDLPDLEGSGVSRPLGIFRVCPKMPFLIGGKGGNGRNQRKYIL